MNKIKGIWFLTRCYFQIMYRLMKSRSWNMMTVNLENEEGKRTLITYLRRMESYELQAYDLMDGTRGLE